jgi:hypothetical protein
MAFFEGYRGFQRALSPRLVARAWHLGHCPTWWHALLAPLFCLSLMHAARRRLLVSWLLVGAVICLALVMHTFAQPARGIIDAGVVVGLSWGVGSILVFTGRALRGRPVEVALELPQTPSAQLGDGSGDLAPGRISALRPSCTASESSPSVES